MRKLGKQAKRYLSIILSALLVFGTCFTLSSCKTREDCIPEELGVAEGLYVYYNNYRSLTDGTEKETLLCGEIAVDGVTYTDEEYRIFDLVYMTSKKEIFYSLETSKEEEERQYFLWHYNYDTKESGWMYTFDLPTYLNASDTYLFACAVDKYNYDKQALLFDGDLNLVQDGLEGYILHNDILYYYKDNSYKFSWWKSGTFFSVEAPYGELARANKKIVGDYVYLFEEDCVYAINLNNGEYQVNDFPKGENFLDASLDYGQDITIGENTYFITYTTVTPTEYENLPLYTGCSLWTISGMQMQRIYSFKEKYEVTFASTCNDKYINLSMDYVPKYFNAGKHIERGVGYYDAEAEKVIEKETKTIEKTRKTFVVGEYEFYTSKVTYGALLMPDYCYYLHRIHNGKDEIMQYVFEEDYKDGVFINPTEFDDIYVR